MKILVSGSHGLVGKALIKALEAEGHEIYRLVRYAPNCDVVEQAYCDLAAPRSRVR